MEHTFQPGDRVRVAADADDVYFGGEVEGVVLGGVPAEAPHSAYDRYRAEGRVNVQMDDPTATFLLTQYVRPADLELIEAAA